MVDHVVEFEGPIFQELVITRIRAAHGFQRARDQIRSVILSAVGNRFPTTDEDGETIVWPSSQPPRSVVPWRGEGGRDYSQIPLPELASLARLLAEPGMDEEEVLLAMKAYFGLERLRETARDRFKRAYRLAQEYLQEEATFGPDEFASSHFSLSPNG
jgi:hypothetical protein